MNHTNETDKRHSSEASRKEKLGMIYVYRDDKEATRSCMVGMPVTQEVYDGMPEYVQENFDRPTDLENEALKAQEDMI